MTVKFTLNNAEVPNGTVLLFGIEYPGLVGGRGDWAVPKVWTYAMLKAGDLWYVTGGGKTPQAAGWGAVERWLERDGRQVVSVKVVTETRRVWPMPSSPCPDFVEVPVD